MVSHVLPSLARNELLAAICALSPSSDNSYLAYPSPLLSNNAYSTPSSSSPGDVLLFDALSLSVTNIVQAHKTPLACVSLNSTGSMLATASDKGTVIRVFSVPNGDKIAQFRRGTYPAKIYHISFNTMSTLLAASSDTETIHIFKLTKDGKENKDGSKGRRAFSASSEGSNGSDVTEDDRPRGGYEALIDQKRQSNSVG